MSFKERTDERRAYCQAGCAFLLSPSLPGGCWPLQEAASTSSKSHCGPSVSLNAVGAWVAAETKPFLLLALHSGYIMPAAAAGGGGRGRSQRCGRPRTREPACGPQPLLPFPSPSMSTPPLCASKLECKQLALCPPLSIHFTLMLSPEPGGRWDSSRLTHPAPELYACSYVGATT